MPPVLSLVMPFKGQSDIDFALSLATRIAKRELLRNPGIPKLYDTRTDIQWQRDVCKAQWKDLPGACERFLSPLQALAEGGIVDCDDAGPWRAAELQLAGDKRAKAFSARSNIGYHVKVMHGDGTIEDPSKKLGMGKKRPAAEQKKKKFLHSPVAYRKPKRRGLRKPPMRDRRLSR